MGGGTGGGVVELEDVSSAGVDDAPGWPRRSKLTGNAFRAVIGGSGPGCDPMA